MFIALLATLNFIPTTLTSPISPSAYRLILNHGFSTNWFKTAEPLSKYNDRNIEDISLKGFTNVRLRSRADLYSPPYNSTDFSYFVKNLTVAVDKCLEVGVAPIISWINHRAEAYASEDDRKDFVAWWTAVAKQLRDKDYSLSFNLFTELGLDGCGGKKSTCGESLRMRPDKYNRWTSDVVAAIRATGDRNNNRILILGSPGKTGKDLDKIDKDIYRNDRFMLAEWHIYASGPNKKVGGQKYWSGDGRPKRRENVSKAVRQATDFTDSSGLPTYLGAWMPADNKDGSLDQAEVINFARYFAITLKEKGIPWSLNVLDRYYDTEKSKWLTERQNIKGRILNMSLVLDNIMEVMRASREEKDLNQPKGTENVQMNNGLFRNTCNMPFYQRMSLVIFSYIIAYNSFFY